MTINKKAVYFFAVKPGIDHVAGHVFNALSKLHNLEETNIIIDEYPVSKYIDHSEDEYYFVRTSKVVCHDYRRYLPIINKYYNDFDMAGLITWHEGFNAPDKVLSVHTTGDVDSGNFGNANPEYMRNLLSSLEKHRIEEGLEDYRITTEATHWSGMVFDGGTPDMIPQFPVPIVDIEIGSTEDSWDNHHAAIAIAKSLTDIFSNDGKVLKNILCVGGTHFESGFANAVLQNWGENAFGISHIIPNQWLVTGNYDGADGLKKLEACIESINGGICGVAMHDGLKGVFKEQMRIIGRTYNIPVFKHQLLRRPEDIPWGN